MVTVACLPEDEKLKIPGAYLLSDERGISPRAAYGAYFEPRSLSKAVRTLFNLVRSRFLSSWEIPLRDFALSHSSAACA
jgi:hypothetical protein